MIALIALLLQTATCLWRQNVLNPAPNVELQMPQAATYAAQAIARGAPNLAVPITGTRQELLRQYRALAPFSRTRPDNFFAWE